MKKESSIFGSIAGAFKPTMMKIDDVAKGLGKKIGKGADDIGVSDLTKPIMIAPLAQRIGVPVATTAAALAVGKELVYDPLAQKNRESSTLKSLKDSTPSLSGVDEKTIKDYFGVIQSFAPKAATNPLVAGALVNKMVQFEGVDSNLVKDLTQIQKSVEGGNIFQKMIEGGASFVSAGM